jgi:hypothetical protein
MSEWQCAHPEVVRTIGLRPLAYHATIDACITSGVFAALVFSGEGIGSVWTGWIVGSCLASALLALVHCLGLGGLTGPCEDPDDPLLDHEVHVPRDHAPKTRQRETP